MVALSHPVGRRRELSLLLICGLLAGCGGLTRNHVYRPLAPVVPETEAALGREDDADWLLDLGDARLTVSPVVRSSKLILVIGPAIVFPVFFLEDEVVRKGPLRVSLSWALETGAVVEFDPRQFTVVLENGRVVSPDALVYWDYHSESEVLEPVTPVKLSGESAWQRNLQYDVALAELAPFTLLLATLEVNGQPVRIPRIHFVPGKAYSGD